MTLRKKKKWPRRLLTLLLYGLSAAMLASVLLVAALRWVNPPGSAFMLQHLVGQWLDDSGEIQLYHRWISWQQIPASLPLAIVAAEDQRFPTHHGLDLTEIRRALQDYQQGKRLRGASTLSQQLAKNLFLWPGQNLLRKGMELWFTLWIEALLPKQRILELYINVAQFGSNTYGAGMAAERFFGKPAIQLTRHDSSLLAAVLPNPRRYTLLPPTTKVKQRGRWIRAQMNNLGKAYLHDISTP